jgi:outer membrane translocation and assembly module TamA
MIAMMMDDIDTTSIDSLSRAQLVELIKQKDEQISQKDEQNSQLVKQKDEHISQLVGTISQQDLKISDAMTVLAAKSNKTEGCNMDELEEDQKMPAVSKSALRSRFLSCPIGSRLRIYNDGLERQTGPSVLYMESKQLYH